MSDPLFLLLIRVRPRPTLFPTRRSSDLSRSLRLLFSLRLQVCGRLSGMQGILLVDKPKGWTSFDVVNRSEEHTSELQSRRDMVCRLLLEKKKATGRRSALAGWQYTTLLP